MTQVNRNCTGDQKSPVLFGTDMLDRLIHPACIMTSRGIIEYSNRAFNDMFRISGDALQADDEELAQGTHILVLSGHDAYGLGLLGKNRRGALHVATSGRDSLNSLPFLAL